MGDSADLRDGIVIDLQRDCINDGTSISPLLRKAKLVASKLEVKEAAEWIDQELGGYKGRMLDVPLHRTGRGQPKFFNPYHGWMDIVVGDDNLADMLCTARLPQPIAELEQLIGGNGDFVIMAYPPVLQEFINKQMSGTFNCGLHLSKSFLHGALDHVRNTILEWSLGLERQGIIGAGMTFTKIEKEAAQMVTNHIYNSNVGVVGAVGGDANAEGFSLHNQQAFESILNMVDRIREAAPALPADVREMIIKPVAALENGAKRSDRTATSKAIALIKDVLAGAGGNLAAAGILSVLGAG